MCERLTDTFRGCCGQNCARHAENMARLKAAAETAKPGAALASEGVRDVPRATQAGTAAPKLDQPK